MQDKKVNNTSVVPMQFMGLSANEKTSYFVRLKSLLVGAHLWKAGRSPDATSNHRVLVITDNTDENFLWQIIEHMKQEKARECIEVVGVALFYPMAREVGSSVSTPTGAYQPQGMHEHEYSNTPDIIGTVDQLPMLIVDHSIHSIVVASPADKAMLAQLVSLLGMQTVNIYCTPDVLINHDYRGHGTQATAMAVAHRGHPQTDVSLISVRAPVLNRRQHLVKRLFDIVVASALLVLLFPVMLIVAIAIKLDSPGPVLFKQERVGAQGKRFKMYKFRSMCQDAERKTVQVVRSDGHGNIIHKFAHDPRVTRVGSFIRRTSLDEIPQLLNVIQGSMSIVGPRPELPWIVETYELWQLRRLSVPQGITGWWQINGRSDKLMHLNSDYDIYYIDNYSLRLDFIILLCTLPAVFRGNGAY
jgi:exopolysaccharide biosynthesis polyprenyl glycosylphosphotransferase